MKIYAVSSGCYSDYSIDAIFSTKEKAQAWIENETDQEEKLNTPTYAGHEFNDVEEYDLDPDMPVHIWKTCWRQDINLQTGEFNGSWKKDGMPWPRRVKTDQTARSESGFYNDEFAWADSYISAEHANKLCVEKRQEWLRGKSVAK